MRQVWECAADVDESIYERVMYYMFSGNKFLDRYKKKRDLADFVRDICSDGNELDDLAEKYELGLSC